jgi:hypothetical protein
MKRSLTLMVLLAAVSLAKAQSEAEANTPTSSEKTYTITALVGGGYSRDISQFEASQQGLTLNRNQFSLFGRVLWRPGNLLTGGLEVGTLNFYSVSNSAGARSVRSAIPIYLLFSMSPVRGLDLGFGWGFAFMSSTAEGPNGSAGSSSFSKAIMTSAVYTYPISTDWRVGGEVRYSYFDHLDDHTFAVSAVVSYVISEY